MSQITKGPLSPEDASLGYAISLYGLLRCGHGWRAGAYGLLCREYDRFVKAADEAEFGVVSVWEYMQLAEATDRYLRDNRSGNYAGWFHKRVRTGLMRIETQVLHKFPFDRRERESMRLAFDRMAPIVKGWKPLKEAWE